MFLQYYLNETKIINKFASVNYWKIDFVWLICGYTCARLLYSALFHRVSVNARNPIWIFLRRESAEAACRRCLVNWQSGGQRRRQWHTTRSSHTINHLLIFSNPLSVDPRQPFGRVFTSHSLSLSLSLSRRVWLKGKSMKHRLVVYTPNVYGRERAIKILSICFSLSLSQWFITCETIKGLAKYCWLMNVFFFFFSRGDEYVFT